jgi:Ca-activated chloride channel homolog
MAGMTAKAVISRADCSNRPLQVNLAASFDIAPAITTIAKSFNKQDTTTAGHCVEVQVTPGEPAAVAAQIDGQDTVRDLAPVDAWIPDSTDWVDEARSYAVGAEDVQPTGITVARSPIMLVTSPLVAKQTNLFAGPPSWTLLLSPGYGGPPSSMGLSVDIPDPTDSAVGLSTLIELTRELGTTEQGRAGFTRFVYAAQDTEEFDSASALGQFMASTEVSRAITEASEQAVVAYDRANPRIPAAAVYPTGATAALGSPELDYPYVVTSTNSAMARAAMAFGRYLQTPYAQSVIRYNGFRSADGVADKFPANSGLSGQPLQLASQPSASEVATSLVSWQKLGLGSRDLAIIDDSSAMGVSTGVDGLTLEQLLTQTAARGLSLFPPTTYLGLWDAPNAADAASPYKNVLPMGALTAQHGVFTRRQQLQEIIATMTKTSTHPLHLYDTILAAYQQMTATYAANYSNAVLVLTAGIDGPGDMSLSSLLTQLRHLYNPGRKVEIVVLQFGTAGDYPALNQIATATGGAAFEITNPVEIGRIFISTIARRMCAQGCTP